MTARPGQSLSSVLAKRAFSVTVPVAVSMWLSTTSSTPVESGLPSVVLTVTFASPCFISALISPTCSSGAGKMTEIGCNWSMTTMPVCWLAATMLPWSMRR